MLFLTSDEGERMAYALVVRELCHFLFAVESVPNFLPMVFREIVKSHWKRKRKMRKIGLVSHSKGGVLRKILRLVLKGRLSM